MSAVLQRLWHNISPCPVTGCWLWTAAVTARGYGRGYVTADRSRMVHILVFEETRGPVPEGCELDHLCRVTGCCNPDHVEPVPHVINVRRGALGAVRRAMTHCIHGHPLSGSNLRIGNDGKRACNECARRRTRDYRARLNALKPHDIHIKWRDLPAKLRELGLKE